MTAWLDWLLFIAVPVLLVAIGVFVMRRAADSRVIGAISNRNLGLLVIGLGTVNFVARLLRSTILR